VRDDRFQPADLRGSYAGAVGMAQFMPSNYRTLALDYDGDGRVDLWSPADAIGSVANYLVNYDPQRSWQRGQALLARLESATPPPAEVPRNAKLARKTIAALRAPAWPPGGAARRHAGRPARAEPQRRTAGMVDRAAQFLLGDVVQPAVYYAMAVTSSRMN